MRTLAAIGLLCLATACTTDSPEATAEEDTTLDGSIVDERTAVFNDASELGITTTHTLDADAVEAVLNTLDTHDDLAWARGHTRYLWPIEEPAGSPAALAVLACDQPPLTDVAQAFDLFEIAFEIDGGGECYGQARLALDGTLLSAAPN